MVLLVLQVQMALAVRVELQALQVLMALLVAQALVVQTVQVAQVALRVQMVQEAQVALRVLLQQAEQAELQRQAVLLELQLHQVHLELRDILEINITQHQHQPLLLVMQEL
jgi:hypothetical protein